MNFKAFQENRKNILFFVLLFEKKYLNLHKKVEVRKNLAACFLVYLKKKCATYPIFLGNQNYQKKYLNVSVLFEIRIITPRRDIFTIIYREFEGKDHMKNCFGSFSLR
jgi:hypothetical protein